MKIKNRLVFEGVDDKHVVGNLLYNHLLNGKRLDECYEPREKNGIDNLLTTMRNEIQYSDYISIGFILDADENTQTRWEQIKYRLEQGGCENVPAIPDPNGTIIRDLYDRKVGIWLMPNNVAGGMLEDFLASLITETDSLWSRAQNVVGDIPADEQLFPSCHRKKAEVHTWLAWQEEPGTQMGGTFKRQFVDPQSPLAMAFVNWIKRLFI